MNPAQGCTTVRACEWWLGAVLRNLRMIPTVKTDRPEFWVRFDCHCCNSPPTARHRGAERTKARGVFDLHGVFSRRLGDRRGERSWTSAAVSWSMIFIGPPHFGQGQESEESSVAEAFCGLPGFDLGASARSVFASFVTARKKSGGLRCVRQTSRSTGVFA